MSKLNNIRLPNLVLTVIKQAFSTITVEQCHVIVCLVQSGCIKDYYIFFFKCPSQPNSPQLDNFNCEIWIRNLLKFVNKYINIMPHLMM